MNSNYLNDIYTEIMKQFNTQKPSHYIVGISGIDCSGKSTLTKQLSQLFHDRGVNTYTVHVDDFLFDRQTRNANPDQANGYYYETFDFDKLFDDIIIPLKGHKKLKKDVELLDWEKDIKYTKQFSFDSPCIVIVEGVLLFKKQFAHLFDYKIWIDITFELGLSRALNRERDVNYYKDKEDILKRYETRFYAGQKLHFKIDEPSKCCDYIITAM